MSIVMRPFPVAAHTDNIGKGSTFVAIQGNSLSGISFIPRALEKGASKIVVDQQLSSDVCDLIASYNATLITVSHARKALAELSFQAAGNPERHLSVIGITGTKGKTTTTFLIEHILRTAGYKTALIGGIKHSIGEQETPSNLTTQSVDYLAQFFSECVRQQVTHVVMEVSSHAIDQLRVYGIPFDIVGLTNIGTDHLDYHKTQQAYFEVKARLFSYIKSGGLIMLNADDGFFEQAFNYSKAVSTEHNTCMISQHGDAPDKRLFSIQQDSFNGLQVGTNKGSFTTPNLFGAFNAYNVMMALNAAHYYAISSDQIRHALWTFPGVPGRLQLHVLKNGARAFVDFAHNPSSMESVLKALRPLTNHLIVVFGCGGGRDATKRPVMGSLAVKFADRVIITDDNPRYEDRNAIINDIMQGVPVAERQRITPCPDRAEAIALAVRQSQHGSVVAVLGKGHETGYLIKGQVYHFDDMEVLQKY